MPTTTQQTFTTVGNGTWVAPAGVTGVWVECWGGGGSGQSGGLVTAGSGGGGGAYTAYAVAVTPGNTYNYTVGSGGAVPASGALGIAGGDSFFGNTTAGSSTGATALAKGGAGGPSSGGGAGGAAASGVPSAGIRYSGGNGGTQSKGGGGSSAGPDGAGTNATTTTGASAGTDAGAGGNGSTSGAGTAGTAPGGGGGGGYNGALSGAGARGQLRITYGAFPSTSVLDNFNRANGAIGSNWSAPVFTGEPAPSITSNQVAGSASTAQSAYWNPQTFNGTVEAYLTQAVYGTSSHVWLNLSNTGANPTGYFLEVLSGAANLYRADVGNLFGGFLSGAALPAAVSGDAFGLSVTSGVLQMWYKPAAGGWAPVGPAATDTTYTSGALGFEISADSALRIDDFGGGQATSTTLPSPRRIARQAVVRAAVR